MFVPVIAMLCTEEDAKYSACIIRWASPTKLAISKSFYSLEEVEKMAAAHRCVNIFFPTRYDGPAFLKDQADKFELKTTASWHSWYIAKEGFNFAHWQLKSLQYRAQKALERQSQDVHSREYLDWINDRAVFYNNGFYDYIVRNAWPELGVKAISACVGKNYDELCRVHEHKSHEYGETNAWAKAIKLGDKYIVYGTGTDTCASDWLNFKIFWVFNSAAEMMDTLGRKEFACKEITEPGTITDLLDFVRRNNLEEKFVKEL